MKKTLLLFAMLLGVVGAWAQEDTFVYPETGKYYKLKGDNKAGKPWLTNQLTSNSIVVSANSAEAAIFLKTENGLKDVATGKYLGMNGDLVSLVTNETNVTIGDYNDNNATGHGIKYSVKVSTDYMYNNNTDGKTHESSGWIDNIERFWGFIEVPSPPILTLTDLETKNYPYALEADYIDKLKGLGSMTIVATVNTAAMGGRMALVCAADPTQAVTGVTKDNSPYFAFGFFNNGTSYLASSRGNDRFSGDQEISSNSWHYVAYVIDETAGTYSAYVDGVRVKNGPVFTNGDADGYRLQTFKKLFNNDTYKSNAKIYIGGGKVTTSGTLSNHDTFNGKVYNVSFYNKALSDEDIINITNKVTLPKKDAFYRISYDYGTTIGKQYLQGSVSPVNKNGQNTPPVSYTTDKGASSIFYYDATGLISYTAGKYVKEQDNDRGLQPIGTTQEAEITPSKRDINKVVVKLGSYLHANTSGTNYHSDHCSSDGDASHDHSLERVEELPVVIGEAGYATFYCPVAVTLPAGLNAYYVSETTGSYAKMEEINDVIPANTGVILEGTPNTYNLTIGGTAENVTNKLSGTVAATYITDEAYVLAKPTIEGIVQEVGFYKATKNKQNNTSWQNNGFKAYLPTSALSAEAAESRFLLFGFGDDMETGITETENGNVKTENTVVYDLAGRRVQGAQKGIFIVNGKKVVR